jgi:hypothetical protein
MTNLTNVPDPFIDNWSEQKEKLKLKISILTGTGFNYADGEKDDMLNKVQIKLGKTKEELLKIISAL